MGGKLVVNGLNIYHYAVGLFMEIISITKPLWV